MQVKTIIWFSTGRDKAARDLFLMTMEEMLWGNLRDKALITKVFCNREQGEDAETDKFLDIVEAIGVPLVCFSSAKFRANYTGDDWRRDYDREIMRRLSLTACQWKGDRWLKDR